MKHSCRFAFERRGLFSAAMKKDILSAVADVFREACSTEYGNIEEACGEIGSRGIEICVTFTDDAGIRNYNREHRGIDRPTDVLSFPALPFERGKGSVGQFDIDPDSGLVFAGDIVISVERATSQAEAYGHGLKREIAFLAMHSCLHLFGYDHVDKEGEKEMERLQEAVLQKLGITRNI
ncbi:MAG: rRNA maturation RNase YbeY [Clostridia bacterium]|nr:rRNA maturation RNase YbeY [Clostridia bacterium]